MNIVIILIEGIALAVAASTTFRWENINKWMRRLIWTLLLYKHFKALFTNTERLGTFIMYDFATLI